MAKLAYKPVGLVAGAAAGLIAGAVFRQVWRGLAGEDEAPSPSNEQARWPAILAAAMLQGAIFGVVSAAVGRAGAIAVRRATGDWPA